MVAAITRIRRALKMRGRRPLYQPHKMRGCDKKRSSELQELFQNETKQRLTDYSQFIKFGSLNHLDCNADGTFINYAAQLLSSKLQEELYLYQAEQYT